MSTGATRKIRCVANYKNGNPCRAYSVRGYLCGQHQHLSTSPEVRAKIAEIRRQNAERERQFNEILAQEAHTRLQTATVVAVPPMRRGYSRMLVFVAWSDIVNRVGWDFVESVRITPSLKFTPYRSGLESQKDKQSEISHLTGSIRLWGMYTSKFPRSSLLCSCLTFGYCENPYRPGQRYDQKYCRSCQRETRAMHNLFRRINEEDGACEHGPGCWPSLDAVIDQGGGRCYYCGESVTRGLRKNTDACRDHYIPVSRGGLHCKDNVVLACRHCNVSKHDNMPPLTRETAASI